MNFNNFVYFVLERNSNPTYSFTGYTDQETGELKFIYKGRKDKKFGTDIPHRFKFDRAHRTIRVHKDEKDIKGNNIVEFLRGFPECKGSKNGHYVDDGNGGQLQTSVWFKEMKEHEDAITAIEAKATKIKAENIALNLEGDELRELAILCSCMNDDEGIQKHRVLEYAGANPSKFLEYYELPEREVKSLIRRGVSSGNIKVKGTIHTWNEITLGVSEDFAVSKLMGDKDLMDALKENLKVEGAG